MPKGTLVHKIYEALLSEGKTKASAARIAQAKSGQALATGKPPKKKKGGRSKVQKKPKPKKPKY